MENMKIMKKTQITKLLHDHGLKATLQRQIICEYLLNTSDHPSADQIYQKISQTYPTIGRATVYSTLKYLKKNNIISELDFGGKSSSRYEPKLHPHINIICPECHQVKDFESERFISFWNDISTEITSEFHQSPIRQGIDLFVYCDSCQEKNE